MQIPHPSLTHQRPQRLPEFLVRREYVEPAVQTSLLTVLPQRHLSCSRTTPNLPETSI